MRGVRRRICGTARNLSFLLNEEEEESKAEDKIIYQLDETDLSYSII